MQSTEPFAKLFRKFRLRSEFETLTEFGDALADFNLVYENSIFSHWQKGTRTPKDRTLILTMIRIFCERQGVISLQEANSIMASTGLGYLTEEEANSLLLLNGIRIPFQVPRRNDVFVGRENLIHTVQNLINQSKIVFLYGQPGVGKTSLSVEMAYLVQDQFPDGIIWCSCDTTSPLAILHEIAQAYGEVLPLKSSLKEASSLYRSFISSKKALFIFDSISEDTPIDLLFPNSSQSAVIVTTICSDHKYTDYGTCFRIDPFSNQEVDILYEKILPSSHIQKFKKELNELKIETGSLPLALQLLTKQIAFKSLTIKKILQQLKESSIINTLQYQNKSLYSSFHLCYQQLSTREQNVLKSCSLFDGPTFSIEALAAIHTMSVEKISIYIQKLVSYSLLEEVHDGRYSLHPLLFKFLALKKTPIKYSQNLARYYIDFMDRSQNSSHFFSILAPESESIVSVIKKCITLNFIDEACDLWQYFGSYYWHVGAWQDFKELSMTMYGLSKKYNKKELQLSICLEEVSRLYYYDGNIKAAIDRAQEALSLAEKINDTYWRSLAHQRYGKLCFMDSKIEEGLSHLSVSAKGFTKLGNYEYLSHNSRYLSEGYVLKKDYAKARTLLYTSLNEIDKVTNTTRQTIYRSVIYSHLGMLDYLEQNYEDAKNNFQRGLQSEKIFPLVRGTYTWLNKMGLALTYFKLKYDVEARELIKKAEKQIQLLGIEKSFPVINVYAGTLAHELMQLQNMVKYSL